VTPVTEEVELILKDGVVIHLAGFPVRIVGEAVISTHWSNVRLIQKSIPEAFVPPEKRTDAASSQPSESK
jgi:hypothetical protein